MYTQLFSIVYIWCLSSELILNDDKIWLDDFAFDASGENGWNIHKTSGDHHLSDRNPMVIISNKAKYHGPLPSNYYMERCVRCNTSDNARLFISMLSAYCNTNKKGDHIEFNIFDTTNSSSTITSFPSYRLNQKNHELDEDHVPFVRNITAHYYRNHSSSSSITPTCASHEQWFRANNHKTYQLKVVAGNIYQIKIHIALNRDTDSYVMLSHISILCVNIPTISPANKPNMSPTASLISNHITFDRTIFTVTDHESTLNLYSITTQIPSTTMNDIDITQKRSLDILHKLKSLHVFYYIGAILLCIACCCICFLGSICLSIDFKLNRFNSLSLHQKNSCLRDMNVAKMSSINAKDSQSSTVSIDFTENSDAASVDFNEMNQGIREEKPAHIKEDDNADSGAEVDGDQKNTTEPR